MNARRIAARALVVVGLGFAFIAILAIYVRMTALNDTEARGLARQLIEQPVIRTEVANASVDELYANVDVAKLMREQFPKSEGALSGPISAGLHDVAVRAVDSALQERSVQNLWVNSASAAHKQLVRILENKNSTQSATASAVLDLHPLVARAGKRIGIDAATVQRLPLGIGQITLLRSDQLASAQRATRALNAVANWFWVLALAAWAAALWLGRGALGRELRAIAAGLVVIGIALLVLRSVVGHYVIDALVQKQSARPATERTWSILTARLADSGWTTIGVGAVALKGLWLATGRHARVFRAALAPLLGSFELAYGLLALGLLTLFTWGPTVQTREFRGFLLITVASIVGFELLRRATAREFPTARAGEFWQTVRGLFDDRARNDVVERLERLSRLHAAGELSAEEFAAAKRDVLKSVS